MLRSSPCPATAAARSCWRPAPPNSCRPIPGCSSARRSRTCSTHDAPPEAAPTFSAMSTILIVDDDEDFREMLVSVLTLRGFNVIAAATTADGLALAATHELDAALSDYQMPKADGLTFCR